MRFYEAFEQALALNKLINRGGGNAFEDNIDVSIGTDVVTDYDLQTEDVLANDWVVIDRPVVGVTLTKQQVKDSWNRVRRNFTAVKDADSSPVLQALLNDLFNQRGA